MSVDPGYGVEVVVGAPTTRSSGNGSSPGRSPRSAPVVYRSNGASG